MFPEVGHHLKCYLIFSEDNFFGSYGTCLDTKRKRLDREDTQYVQVYSTVFQNSEVWSFFDFQSVDFRSAFGQITSKIRLTKFNK
jgi:hypothetical protein